MYIVLCKSCINCGDIMIIKKFDKQPTQEDIREVKGEIGGMFCIKSHIIDLTEKESYIIKWE